MPVANRPSDSQIAASNYTNGIGYYTTSELVTNLLGIAPFDNTTTLPALSDVGELIKRAEDYIDEYTRESWRPLVVENEYHDFDFDLFKMHRLHKNYRYRDYVGNIRLQHEHLRKIIRLAVWRGNTWEELGGATAKIKITDYANITNIVLTVGPYTWTLLPDTVNNDNTTPSDKFNNHFGNRTTAMEIVYLINEQMPLNTQSITGSSGVKNKNSDTLGVSLSNYFYATLEEDDTIVISSLLPGDDGDACTLAVTGGSNTVTDFADTESRGRDGDWWVIGEDGSVFFRASYPYQMKHSLRITYLAGNSRVPAIITEAATKLVACELMQADDNNLLLGENQESGVDIKTKYDSYKADIDKILSMKKRLLYFMDGD
tara:strand:+ start:37 stop:1155 length:1119 start_codon:yes stop_codon:yes gene_type:complete